ncbi:Bromodomain and WD repeat-containing protein 1 [Astathelohania contejeani]|uniref:Bromodomain and WD repeat-containing protein 1 n=1 Tax=Astathelohania contejeani TaxID=164912 RepID=A0ABQ7I007_9MICR|nr:Bromodomain and WD repeat-containing protein 1 [Thelohania contejeani]
MDENKVVDILSLMNYLVADDNTEKQTLEKKTNLLGINKSHVLKAINAIQSSMQIENIYEFIRKYKFSQTSPSEHEKFLLHRNNMHYIADKFDIDSYINQYKYTMAYEVVGHISRILCISFDKTEKMFFTGGDDGIIKIWDIESGMLIRSLLGHKNCIFDLCLSGDGKYLASGDSIGTLIIWRLSDFTIIYTFEIGMGIEFVEFGKLNENGIYNLICLGAMGILKNIKFNDTNIIEEIENASIALTAEPESTRAICITEGGRFILCGGTWPFLLLFDVQNIKDALVVLQTEGFNVFSLCASRKKFKVAASTAYGFLIQWEFFEYGEPIQGNFKKRKNTSLTGHWKRSVTELNLGEELYLEIIAFLADDKYLVGIQSDRSTIYVYKNLSFITKIEFPAGHTICPHPLKNIFAVGDKELRIYDVNGEILFKENIEFGICDIQFTSDGEYLIVGNMVGNTKVFSICPFSKSYENVPKEQFFSSDFQHLNLLNENANEYFIECEDKETFDYNKNKNETWKKIEYHNNSINYNYYYKRSNEYIYDPNFTVIRNTAANNILIVEQIIHDHLKDEFITIEEYQNKYFVTNPIESTSSTTDEDIMVSTESEETVSKRYCSDEFTDSEVNIVENTSRQRSKIIKESSNDGEHHRRRRRRNLNYISSDESSSGTIEEEDVSDEESSVIVNRRRKRNATFEEISKRKKNNSSDEDLSLETRNSNINYRRRRKAAKKESAEEKYNISERELMKYINDWLTMSSKGLLYFPQLGDKVYFIAERYLDLIGDTAVDIPPTGVYIITRLDYSGDVPVKAIISLNETYVISYYPHPSLMPALLHQKYGTLNLKRGQNVTLIRNKKQIEAKYMGEEGDKLKISIKIPGSRINQKETVYLDELHIDEYNDEIFTYQQATQLKRLLRRCSEHKPNSSYPINIGLIRQRIDNLFYVSIDSFVNDLRIFFFDSASSDIKFRNIMEEVIKIIGEEYRSLLFRRGRRIS